MYKIPNSIDSDICKYDKHNKNVINLTMNIPTTPYLFSRKRMHRLFDFRKRALTKGATEQVVADSLRMRERPKYFLRDRRHPGR